MNIKNNKQEKELALCIKEINKSRKVDEEGKTFYEGFSSNLWEGILLARVEDFSSAPYIRKKEFIKKILFKSRQEPLNSSEFVKEYKELENRYLQTEKRKYHLFTDIQLEGSFPFKSLKVNNSYLYFRKDLRKYTRKRLDKEIEKIDINKPSLKFKPIIVEVHARCGFEAFDKALFDLDIFRATVDIMKSRGKISFLDFSYKSKPINHISLGPIRTLHHPDGNLALGSFFQYDREFNNEIRHINYSYNRSEANKLPYYFKKITKTSKIAEIISKSLVLYIRSLDYRDVESAYIHLWSP